MAADCNWEQEAVEHLVAIRGQLEIIKAGAVDLVRRIDGVIAQVSGISVCADRIDLRLDRIERRLEQIDTNLH